MMRDTRIRCPLLKGGFFIKILSALILLWICTQLAQAVNIAHEGPFPGSSPPGVTRANFLADDDPSQTSAQVSLLVA
jgi:hypothetical protein